MAVDAGFRTAIVLDLARVGMGGGAASLGLLRDLAARHPEVEWVAGGGVRDRSDVDALSIAGASAVLVGSAIHDGRIAPDRPGPAGPHVS